MADGTQSRDLGRTRIEAMFRELDGLSVRIGFVGESSLKRPRRRSKRTGKKRGRGSPKIGPARVVDVATFHEFGTVRMAARPFMRPTFRNARKVVARVILSEVRRLIKRGGPPIKVMERIGVRYKAMVQKSIRDLNSPPLKQSTLRKRQRETGDSDPNPLVDTGQMIQSVSWIVARRGSDIRLGPGVR